ncbi:MAG: hypothetical protein DRG20_06160 [Deltaproteobacteria bacterium]|nr:MAG: hypothetical protein DRG20_06160 [Deltaproteobacteria bacterium]
MKLEELLLKQEYIDEDTMNKAVKIQSETGKDIGDILLDMKAIDQETLSEAIAFQQSLEFDKYENKENFLKNIIPFDSLKVQELKDIASDFKWRKFSPDELIIKQGVQGTNFYLIKSGLAKVYLEEAGKETIIGFLGEGDCFGEMSLLTNDVTTSNVKAVEDTICLFQDKEKFLNMIEKYPQFYNFFNQLLTQRMRTVYKELLSESPGITQVEPFLFRKQIKDMISYEEPFCKEQYPIQEAARDIIEKRLSSMVVIDDQKRAKGLIGLRGIVKSVLLEGVDTQKPVEIIMDRDFYPIDAKSYFFDALHQMVKHQTKELVVLDGKKVQGLLTGFDLLRFRGREVLSIARNIENATDFSQLNKMREDVTKLLIALMNDGALASQACKIITEFNDKVVKRIIKLVEKECGTPPTSYAWLGLGSEGRKEQTLFTDQDNAIIFGDSSSDKTKEYFKKFASMVVDRLNECGYPLCKGGVMALNDKWFGNLEDWKERTKKWSLTSFPEQDEILDNHIFLDFRTVYGDEALEKELKSHVFDLTEQRAPFLISLAQSAVSMPIPLGFFKNFIVEKNGKYKNRLNLKLYGLVPLTTCVRVLALKEKLPETNTLERIKVLNKKNIISDNQAEFLEQAFETFLTLRIRNHLSELDKGEDLSNYISPAELSIRQKQLLKEGFLAVSQLQKTTSDILKIKDIEKMIRY